MTARFYHGGIAGLRVGDLLKPSPPHVTDGCPVCVARAEGRTLTVGEYRRWLAQFGERARAVLEALADADDCEPVDPPSERVAVYVTSDITYARWYAARSQGGVEPLGELTRSATDHFPTWTVPEARVVDVIERRVRLVRSQRRELLRRWRKADRDAALAGRTHP